MPRKTAARELHSAAARAASMRPRPDAAENAAAAPAEEETQVASMRPRPDAAENQRDVEAGRVGHQLQ